MEAEKVIKVRGVGKRYWLRKTKLFLLRDLVRRIMRKPRSGREFWSLRDITFNVRRGEAVAIVGHNAAGKSTLLGIVAGTVFPTTGEVEVTGRVCALLELGAGFHPDLTGRENVILNASLLGLNRREVEDRFEEIVAFAELEEFIDQPLRTYSSGMWIRLGFSVAVFAEPEILIIDEVLAVGDKDFQQKCIDRILKLKEEGTTFLFVSHAPDHVRLLCDRGIWIEHGVIEGDGDVETVLRLYEYTKTRGQTLHPQEPTSGTPMAS